MKEQDVEMIDIESEELGSDTQLGFKASKITDSEQDLDMKLNKNERHLETETKEDYINEEDLEMKENEAYCSIQI